MLQPWLLPLHFTPAQQLSTSRRDRYSRLYPEHPYALAAGDNVRSNSPSAQEAGRRVGGRNGLGGGAGHHGGSGEESFVVLPDSTPLLSESYFSLSRTGGGGDGNSRAGDNDGSDMVMKPAVTSREMSFVSTAATAGASGVRVPNVHHDGVGGSGWSENGSRLRSSSYNSSLDATGGGGSGSVGTGIGNGSGVILSGPADGYSRVLDRYTCYSIVRKGGRGEGGRK